jgi:putative ABC transport system ATP-binding protein
MVVGLSATGLVARGIAFADQRWETPQLLVVRGPSGCGKTTWLMLLAGLLSPQAGHLTGAWAQPGQAVLVAQQPYLLAALNVQQNLLLALKLAKQTPRPHAIAQTLAALDIQMLAKRPVTSLSRGQQQRVALARGLIVTSPLLLCDEPSANLDDANTARMASALVAHAKQHQRMVVVASHDARLINAFGDVGAGVLTLPASFVASKAESVSP